MKMILDPYQSQSACYVPLPPGEEAAHNDDLALSANLPTIEECANRLAESFDGASSTVSPSMQPTVLHAPQPCILKASDAITQGDPLMGAAAQSASSVPNPPWRPRRSLWSRFNVLGLCPVVRCDRTRRHAGPLRGRRRDPNMRPLKHDEEMDCHEAPFPLDIHHFRAALASALKDLKENE
jgi:hypothetical protein